MLCFLKKHFIIVSSRWPDDKGELHLFFLTDVTGFCQSQSQHTTGQRQEIYQHRYTHHLLSHLESPFGLNMHISGPWEETGEPGRNPDRQTENMKTPYWVHIESWTQDSLATRRQCQSPSHCVTCDSIFSAIRLWFHTVSILSSYFAAQVYLFPEPPSWTLTQSSQNLTSAFPLPPIFSLTFFQFSLSPWHGLPLLASTMLNLWFTIPQRLIVHNSALFHRKNKHGLHATA